MAKPKKKTPSGQIAYNKRARYDYNIVQTIEAGVVLVGSEVKAIREGQVDLSESYAVFKGIKPKEIFLLNGNISTYSHAKGHLAHETRRTRKLLLHKHEIERLSLKAAQQGWTIVPLAMYWSKGNIKIELGLGSGKNTVDKRQTIKDREWKIEKQKAFMSKNRT